MASWEDPIAMTKEFHYHWRNNVEQFLHPWNKSHLIMVHHSFKLCLCFPFLSFQHIAEKVLENRSIQINHLWRTADLLSTKAILSSTWGKHKKKNSLSNTCKEMAIIIWKFEELLRSNSWSKWESQLLWCPRKSYNRKQKGKIVTACYLCLHTGLQHNYYKKIQSKYANSSLKSPRIMCRGSDQCSKCSYTHSLSPIHN